MSEYIVRITDDMPYEIKAELNAWYIESEPIVRCRDCRHSEQDLVYKRLFCHRFGLSDKAGFPVDPDGFCACGERRDA